MAMIQDKCKMTYLNSLNWTRKLKQMQMIQISLIPDNISDLHFKRIDKFQGYHSHSICVRLAYLLSID